MDKKSQQNGSIYLAELFPTTKRPRSVTREALERGIAQASRVLSDQQASASDGRHVDIPKELRDFSDVLGSQAAEAKTSPSSNLLPKVSSLTTGEVVRESTHSNFPSSHRNESPSSILPILDDKERARKRHWGTIMGSNEPVLNPAAPWSIVHASEYANIRRTTPPRAPSNRDDIPDFSTEEKCTNHLTGLLDAQPEYQPSSPQTSPQPTLLPPCLVDLERRNGIEFSSTNSIGFPVEIKKSEDLTKKITKRGSRGSSFTEGRSDYKKETDASSEPKLASSGSFQCPKCAHLFRRKYDMRSHISAVHDKRRPHRCPYVHICSSSFAHRGTMTKHISTVHLGFRGFACNHSGCSAKFSEKGNLRNILAAMEAHSTQEAY